MRQLFLDEPGVCTWHEVPEPELDGPFQALVRPIAVASCDLDVAVAQGFAPLRPGYAVGHEGIAEVVAVGEGVATVSVGDPVVVPFQISCGLCSACARGVTGSCDSVPPRAMYGLGSIAGFDGGGFLSDLVKVPYADAMLVTLSADIDVVALASLSDNIPDGWRAVGPYATELAALTPTDRRVLVTGGLSIGLYAAAIALSLGASVDYIDTDATRLATAEALGATTHDSAMPTRGLDPYPVSVNTSANPDSLIATLRATWPYGVCTDTGIYYQNDVALPLLEMYGNGIRFVTGRANSRSDINHVLDLVAAGLDLRPIVETVTDWDAAPETWAHLRGKTTFVRT